jgi:dTDP-4-amino-4,6-dideoxygalactose transaminase
LLRDGGRHNDQLARIPAINSRLDEMQCCYLRAFLPHLRDWTARRAQLAGLYDALLKEDRGVRPVPRGEFSVDHLYVVRAGRREQLRRRLALQGVMTAIHYAIPLHHHPAFRTTDSLPHAEKACREIASLPLWPYLGEERVRMVAAAAEGRQGLLRSLWSCTFG